MLTKELERAGLPTAHICVITQVAKMVGSNRIIPGKSIVTPLGDPNLNSKEEEALRMAILEKALTALQTDMSEQRIFE